MSRRFQIGSAAGLASGVVIDQICKDVPNRFHPVAWFGTWSNFVEPFTWRDSHSAGAIHVLATLTPVVAIGSLLSRLRHLSWLTYSLSTWAVIGAASLSREGIVMASFLESGDLDAARGRLSYLCGRDPDRLDEPELCRATIESLAENTADAAVASLFWGAVAGLPGMLIHRAVNTLDAMIGHKNDRYRRFGTAAARLDDVLDYIPARITGALTCLLAPLVGGNVGQAWAIMNRDGAKHPSPNGGWCESAFAGALKVRLGGCNQYYGNRSEFRPYLGDGQRPKPEQIRKASTLVKAVTGVATIGAFAVLAGREWLLRRIRRQQL